MIPGLRLLPQRVPGGSQEDHDANRSVLLRWVMAITIHGAGCALMDYLYRGVDFHDEAVTRLRRRTPGDGGLTIGGLVFAEALESFAGLPVDEALRSVTGGRDPDRMNVGGPAIVSLIHTAQLRPDDAVRFFGAVGDDGAGDTLRSIVSRTPLDTTRLSVRHGATAATYVLSDPDYDDGHGERMFINRLGVAADLTAEDLGDDFHRADIVQLGGTALVPRLHEAIPPVLARARAAGALTIVNTVYDFRAESTNPGRRWTLGGDEAYPLVDLLITDAEEALRLSGCGTPRAAVEWFLRMGASAAVVTNGPGAVWCAASGGRFAARGVFSRPAFTEFAKSERVRGAGGDTTGCGDTFAGGLVASIATQLDARLDTPAATGGAALVDLDAAVRLAVASGAFCLTHLGGTFLEERPGEKAKLVAKVQEAYEGTEGGHT